MQRMQLLLALKVIKIIEKAVVDKLIFILEAKVMLTYNNNLYNNSLLNIYLIRVCSLSRMKTMNSKY